MHLLDLILLIIIAGWGIAGAFTGFVPQLITLLSLIFAAVGTWLFYPLTAYKLEGLIQSPELSIIVAPIILLILILLLSKVILNLIFKAIRSEESSGNGWLPGAAFGVCKGLILGGVLVYFLGQYGKPELIEDSISFRRYYHASEWVVSKSDEYGLDTKITQTAAYLRENLLPPSDLRGDSIESAAQNFYNKKIAGYFEEDFFSGISDFLSSDKKPQD